MNIFNPSAYVRKVSHQQLEVDSVIIAEKQKDKILDSKEFALTRCPNKKHGKRIYVDRENGQVIAVSVSPINENFRSQIEDGVWDIVKSLLDKNYFTISSCEGHFNEGPLQFIVAIPNLELAEKLKKLFNEIKFVKAEIRETCSNIEIDIKNHKNPKFKRMKEEVVDFQEEAKDINHMYFRNYDRYWFLRVHIYKKGKIWSLLQFIFTLFFEKKCKQNILNLIRDESFPVSPF